MNRPSQSFFLNLFLSLCLLAASACSHRAPSSLRTGRVVAVHTQTDRADTGLGRGIGGVLGSLTGLVVGSGRGSYVASAGGAIGGQIAGSHVAKNTTTGQSSRYVIQFPAGDTVSVSEKNASGFPRFKVGQNVRVYFDGRDYQLSPSYTP
ncbi:MAG: TOBE domain-containing protein [Verrucomicrobiales bacterium]